jgi:hypothetical protein
MKAKESKTKKSPADSSSATSSRKTFSGTIRAPREKDHARLADLAGQLSYPSTAQEISHRLAAMADSNENATFVAEMPDGEIAGWIAVFILRGLEVHPRGEISGFIVLRDRAHAFYLREGYQHTKTQKTFRKNLTAKS